MRSNPKPSSKGKKSSRATKPASATVATQRVKPEPSKKPPNEPTFTVDMGADTNAIEKVCEAALTYALDDNHPHGHRVQALQQAHALVRRFEGAVHYERACALAPSNVLLGKGAALDPDPGWGRYHALRARMTAVATRLFACGGTEGAIISFPLTADERVSDLGAFTYFRTGGVERANVGDLLARMACDETPVALGGEHDLLGGILRQGEAEARAWSKHAGDEMAVVFEAMARRFTAAAEIAKRERERPACAVVLDAERPDGSRMMYGSEHYRSGKRMLSVVHSKDPVEMAKRLNDSLKRTFGVEERQ
jgi:hypothetical protein